ncbi:hypothetical protein BIW11_11879, partial [Tropilaelaps mercedesae]
KNLQTRTTEVFCDGHHHIDPASDVTLILNFIYPCRKIARDRYQTQGLLIDNDDTQTPPAKERRYRRSGPAARPERATRAGQSGQQQKATLNLPSCRRPSRQQCRRNDRASLTTTVTRECNKPR